MPENLTTTLTARRLRDLGDWLGADEIVLRAGDDGFFVASQACSLLAHLLDGGSVNGLHLTPTQIIAQRDIPLDVTNSVQGGFLVDEWFDLPLGTVPSRVRVTVTAIGDDHE